MQTQVIPAGRSFFNAEGKPVYDNDLVAGSAGMLAPYAVRVFDSVASAETFLRAELALIDPQVAEPLTSFTYIDDIPMQAGGGYNQFEEKTGLDYGLAGGSGSGAVGASGNTVAPIVQLNTARAVYATHFYATVLRIKHNDLMRMQQVGRSLEQMLATGNKVLYAKHMDENGYLGFSAYGTTGLVNNPDVTVTGVAEITSGSATYTDWLHKDNDQIIADIANAMTAVWKSAGYSREAVPDYITMPYKQYDLLVSRRLALNSDVSLLDYILNNNLAKNRGKTLRINANPWCEGAGTDGTDRMVVYCKDERYLAMRELLPLTRIMTSPNAEQGCYDTRYEANIGQLKIHNYYTIGYFDGI